MPLLAEIDLFDKLADRELRSSTTLRKALTLVLCIVWCLLVVAEFRDFLTLDIFHNLHFESENLASRPDLVNISLLIDVGMPC
jgi:hypothetical protein